MMERGFICAVEIFSIYLKQVTIAAVAVFQFKILQSLLFFTAKKENL